MSQERRPVARSGQGAPATNTLSPPTALVLLDRPVGDDVFVLVTERGKEQPRSASDAEPLPPRVQTPRGGADAVSGSDAIPAPDTTLPLKLTFFLKAGEDPNARDKPPRRYTLFQVREGVRSMLFQNEAAPVRTGTHVLSWEVDAEHLLSRRWESARHRVSPPVTSDDELDAPGVDYSAVSVDEPLG